MNKLFRLTFRRWTLVLCLLATAWPAAHADVTIFVQAASAPNLHVFDTNGTCTGTNSGTAFNSYTTWPGGAMNKSVTTSDGKTWFYEVFTGLNSASVILNNESSQTDDITGLSGIILTVSCKRVITIGNRQVLHSRCGMAQPMSI